MTEMFSIARASLRMGRAAWHLALPSGAKLVLLCIISHYNDARGCAFPSLARLAQMCGLHKRTVQAHIRLLGQNGILQVGKAPGLCTHVYRINEAALAPPPSTTDMAQGAENIPTEGVFLAPSDGDFSANSAEITTQNGSNGHQQKKTTEATAKAQPMAAFSSSTSLFLQFLSSPQDQAALQTWQQVRQSKGRPALPNAQQCQQLLHHAASLNQSLGWVVQVMALNDWALFDPAWLNNQRPPPRLPTVAAPPLQPPPQPRPPEATRPAVTREEAAQAKARMAALLEEWHGPQPTHFAPITPCGIPWADNIIASAVRGETVGYAALDFACTAAKVSRRAVQAAAKAAPPP